jgi:2-C-methyl-D-erythritol 4-phosphate cytidylyltransferase
MPHSAIGTKAILLMAGTGIRFGSETPKQFHRLAGKKVYLHTLETFLNSGLFEQIVLVCPAKWLDEIKQDLGPYSSSAIKVIEGGATRQESSLKGLLACGNTTQYVVIHDAVRPFVEYSILKHNLEEAISHQAVDTCIPSTDTLVYAPNSKHISSIPSRTDYLRGQTPQSFAYPLILQAHLKAQEEKVTNSSDDCSLVLRLNHPVRIVAGNEENIKITSELDLFLAEQILRFKQASGSLKTKQQSLAGKRLVVTGGTGGIGQAICTLLKEQGAIPLVLSRSSEPYSADLTSYEATKQAFNQILVEYGPLDGLINSIGWLKTKEFDQLSNEEIDGQIATNLTGVIYSCRCAQLKKGAHIINIASSSYIRGRKNYAIYASAKAAVVNFTQGLAEERPDQFVNVVVPQRTHTQMRLENFPEEDPNTLLTPADVAKEILSLLQQCSLTGTIVEVRKK